MHQGLSKGRWRPAWRLGRAVAIGYGLVILFLMWFEESLIFFPSVYPIGDWKPPGISVEDAHFQAADGTRLHGWFVEHEKPRAVVLFAHGNAGNITHRIDQLLKLRSMGLSVLVFDYRGYGRSEGRPTEAGILADARAARQWLAERAAVAESDIVLLGESVGAAVMVELAAADGARGLVLESTFTSLPEMGAYHYPWVPARWIMRSRLDSLNRIGQYQGPLLQCHGDADRIIPFEQGRRLFEAANEPKQFVRLPDHDHNDLLPPEYYQALDEFISSLETVEERERPK